MSSIGLPMLNGFVGEFLILLGAFLAHPWYAVVAASGVVLAAAYMLWMFRRVMFGRRQTRRTVKLIDLDLRAEGGARGDPRSRSSGSDCVTGSAPCGAIEPRFGAVRTCPRAARAPRRRRPAVALAARVRPVNPAVLNSRDRPGSRPWAPARW
jgi:NADH:ubiquinone oxidoreductase subunit 5 (subunit L)/multisubunit Na+/H+ antiporter MnhA subunit